VRADFRDAVAFEMEMFEGPIDEKLMGRSESAS
jgi:hypothetical protein